MAQRMITPSESYAALFAQALAGLPGARQPRVRRQREAGFESFRAAGFPGPKTEEWKYTSVAPLVRLDYGLPEAQSVGRQALDPWLIGDPGARHAVFVNGRFAPELSDIGSDPGIEVVSLARALDDGLAAEVVDYGEEHERSHDREENRGFRALNTALASDGCFIRLADGAAPKAPVQLLFVSVGEEGPKLINARNVIVLGAGAALDLVETHVFLGEGRNLTNLVNRVHMGAGAVLRHDRLQAGEASGSLIGKSEYDLSADARLTQSLATLGGGLVRNEIEANLNGPRIAAQMNGIYLTGGRQHVDNVIRVVHAAPNSESDQFYKGVLDGQSRAAFAGKIIVEREAQKTNAYQTNNNLLLSPEAEINTKPELEIFADDVKCSHGATAGELDERELFYLRSRGLDPATARSLLTYAFVEEVLERFGNESTVRQARREVVRRLPGGVALEELA
jgi:Fe-S cluster assembly protein SufD